MLNSLKRSGIPEKFPIKREEDYHTHFIGRTEDGRQFFGCETFVFPDGIPADEWQQHRREYVVLYLFDIDGNHVRTDHWYAGTTAEANESVTRKKLEQMVGALGKIQFTDIVVKPFQTTIDGVVFGLVPNEEYDVIELQPSSTIAFHEPWDGEYDT